MTQNVGQQPFRLRPDSEPRTCAKTQMVKSSPLTPLLCPSTRAPTVTDCIPFTVGNKAEYVVRAAHHYRYTNAQHTVRDGSAAVKRF